MEDNAPVASTLHIGLLDNSEGEGRTWLLKEPNSRGFEVVKAVPQPAAVFTGKGIDSQHGKFSNLNVGVAYGGGCIQPGNIVNDEANPATRDMLINSVPFQRLSSYTTGIFKPNSNLGVTTVSVLQYAVQV
ncbi:hypothetical protein BDP27DRAFT_1410850 [Rhodocollybia butyracea]|uniref:Uncharacterized protein n=1 Tax=Rhodocollybia butyracea TaxID=206335 RepID=A0A9P5P525_9AGAR|nr:hypothetical protein BDP27DRAFT_1410850 [Rhodocollybia butyracea]